MFKKTATTPQLNMFADPSLQLGKRAIKKYTDPKAWHNQFFRMVTSKIDEDLFKPLFKDGNMGAPNASVRIIVAMSILKEGFGCSDEELFEKCEFDLLTRRALGLVNLSDKLPSLDTYYLFRRRVCTYYDEKGVDLMKETFEGIAGGQVRELQISGKCVRMDSKLIGSNIARFSRYELIHRTLTKFLSHETNMAALSGDLLATAKDYMEEDPGKTVYRSDKDVLQNRLGIIGSFIHSILPLYDDTFTDVDILRRVFDDQYEVTEDGRVVLRDRKKVSADSLQSPYDKDASFRNKHGRQVSGYVTNITETVEDGKPSIITSVQTETATKADCHMLQEAVANSEEVTGTRVEAVYADGAYQSPENRKYAEGHGGMQLKTGKMQGGNRWALIPHDGDRLTVVEKTTGRTFEAVKAVTNQGKRNRWRIPWNNKTGWRYFEDKDIEAYRLRQQTESLPAEERNKRNNVEATMFQYSFHTRNGKTRYRGLLKHRMHAYARCAWMNLRRIVIFLGQHPLGLFFPFLWLLGRIFEPLKRIFSSSKFVPEIATRSILNDVKSEEMTPEFNNATF
jgi:hypothetical protein